MKATASWTVAAVALLATPLHAQVVVVPRHVVGAAILSDIVADRQAQRDARQTPYAAPGYGPIDTAGAARDACAEKALYQAGPASRLIGPPRASTMSTGWEVEGVVGSADGDMPFVCSVRNGSVSGVLLRR
ncbi:hypothetical protein ASE85_03620 [Sphingobium sp. Leaf26]|uniref:hypothetical protein n=1 Tax=Sphingobium sp. Leaf26 TaxID=1735693 RepID=UPI0006F1E167|nr:hypothetical protein [Sphingobium sp. Leaf26]KQN10289.1 hypothetical protein ASE85_03620 [Sphingobium sp. Leaf26]